MSLQLNRRSLLKKLFQVGGLTLLSKLLGIVRENLQAQFLGVGALSDAFITAFKVPNFFRRIFAEGALSAAFIPHFITIMRSGERARACRLMAAASIFFEGIVLLLCLLIVIFPAATVYVIAPGFSAEQIAHTIPFLQILFPFIFFISSSALLAGALQSANNFSIAAIGPVILNIFYIAALVVALVMKTSAFVVCAGILLGGAIQLLTHVIAYWYLGFSFQSPDRRAWHDFGDVLAKFLPFFLGASVVEINVFIDMMIGSYLPKGELTLLYYASRYMQMPLSIFAVALSTVLLPHFSRLALYAKKRLAFYLLESTKLVVWVMVPTTLFLMLIAEPIFALIMLRSKATTTQIWMASYLLIILASGLVAFSLHRVIINVFYALKDASTPTWTAVLSAVLNCVGNIAGIMIFGVYGLAAATVLSSAIMLGICLAVLQVKHGLRAYSTDFFKFLVAYGTQLTLASLLFLLSYACFFAIIALTPWKLFFTRGVGYWLFTIPLFCCTMMCLFQSRTQCGVRLYFLGSRG